MQTANKADPQLLQRLGADAYQTFFAGGGCNQCRNTGYLSRIGIFELLRINEPVRQAILRRAGADELAAISALDRRSMRQDGVRLAAKGSTTLDEVLRVTQDSQTDEAIS